MVDLKVLKSHNFGTIPIKNHKGPVSYSTLILTPLKLGSDTLTCIFWQQSPIPVAMWENKSPQLVILIFTPSSLLHSITIKTWWSHHFLLPSTLIPFNFLRFYWREKRCMYYVSTRFPITKRQNQSRWFSTVNVRWYFGIQKC